MQASRTLLPRVSDEKPCQARRARSAVPVHPVLALQRAAGNQAVAALLNRYIQRAATVSTPGDPFEREADEVADRVMRMAEPEAVGSSPVAVQRMCTACEEEENVHRASTPEAGQALPLAPEHDPVGPAQLPGALDGGDQLGGMVAALELTGTSSGEAAVTARNSRASTSGA